MRTLWRLPTTSLSIKEPRYVAFVRHTPTELRSKELSRKSNRPRENLNKPSKLENRPVSFKQQNAVTSSLSNWEIYLPEGMSTLPSPTLPHSRLERTRLSLSCPLQLLLVTHLPRKHCPQWLTPNPFTHHPRPAPRNSMVWT